MYCVCNVHIISHSNIVLLSLWFNNENISGTSVFIYVNKSPIQCSQLVSDMIVAIDNKIQILYRYTNYLHVLFKATNCSIGIDHLNELASYVATTSRYKDENTQAHHVVTEVDYFGGWGKEEQCPLTFALQV